MLERLGEIILDLKARLDRQPTFGWAVVTSVTPLMIRYDAQSEPIAGTPDRLVSGLAVGDRVWCQRIHRRDIILGRATGQPGQEIGFVSGTANVSANLPFLDVTVHGETPGKAVEVELSSLGVSSPKAGTIAAAVIRYTTDGSVPSSTSPVLVVVRSAPLPSGGAVSSIPGGAGRVQVGASGKLRFAVFVSANVHGPDGYWLKISRL